MRRGRCQLLRPALFLVADNFRTTMTRRKASNMGGLPQDAANTAKRAVRSLEKALLTREEWLRLAAQGSQLGLWYWDEITQGLFCDRRTREMFGVTLKGEVTVETFYKVLHPDDAAWVRKVWRDRLEKGLPYDIEYRVQRSDGSIRWINARGSGYYDRAGKPRYMIGVVFDITERKEVEQQHLQFGGRLINAQEQERMRLAQEIHDDFGQRLSLFMVELEAIAQMTKETNAGKRLRELIRALGDLTHDIHSVSHRLYSSKLEVLGLVPSIRSLCAEFAKQHGIQTRFEHGDVPHHLPTDTALSLFRIVQEGLHNVSKHSGASKVKVGLRGNSDGISLTVCDNGTGFNLSDDLSRGIGIQGMRERARWLGGRFEIKSRPLMEGTQIAVTVPLKSVRTAA